MRRSAVFSPRRPGRGSQNYPADWLPEQPTGPTRLYSFLNGPNLGLTHVAILGKKERKKGKFSIEEVKKYSAGPRAGNSFPEEQGHAARSRGLTELREARPVT